MFKNFIHLRYYGSYVAPSGLCISAGIFFVRASPYAVLYRPFGAANYNPMGGYRDKSGCKFLHTPNSFLTTNSPCRKKQ